ncbi:MAG: glycosyl hydrolase family 28-related protein [Planctomycetota bacterium]
MRVALVAICLMLPQWEAAADSWRSTLYPADWRPPSDKSFATDKLIQDFSYAGYQRGEAPLPQAAGPVFDPVSFGADPTGATDSTSAIRSAIFAAEAAGGGVVDLPAGTFRVSAGSNSEVFRVRESGVVIRGAGPGATRILNTSTNMRGKAIFRFAPGAHSSGPSVGITQNLTTPTHRVPVANAAAFSTGDLVEMEWDFTDEWIAEHGQQEWWNDTDGRPEAASYRREVTAVNVAQGWIEVDVPTRYSMLPRDNARVKRLSGYINESGVEGLSIGNVQHPGSEFGEQDHTVPGTAAHDVHGSWAIDFQRSVDSWVRDVETFQPDGNTSTAHILSNGVRFLRSFRMTASDVRMERPQYGGGGGNGYMFRVQSTNDSLIEDSVAEFNRHGFVISHAGSTGNVFHQVEDRFSNRATGDTGSYPTGGGDGSDTHMHFGHSNLWDQSHAHNSFLESQHRGTTNNHGLTSAHGVYWNISGSGTQYPDKLVVSEQGRYGYVIGTSGSVDAILTPTGQNTAPTDHAEGEGEGARLFPQSLFLDQRRQRLGSGVVVTSFSSSEPGSTLASQILLDAEGYASTPTGLDVDVTGRVLNPLAAGGTIGVVFDAMKDVSMSPSTLGNKLVDGNVDRDSAGRIGVSGGPEGGGLSSDATQREGMQLLLDATSGIDPTAKVQIDTINISWLNTGESFTIVNLATRESLEFIGEADKYPHFDYDVSALNLSLLGGQSGAVAAVIAGDDSGFRIRGVNLSIPDEFFNPLPGDYNADGVVDTADYSLWRDTLGQSVDNGRFADGDNSGVIDVADYNVWKANFGRSATANAANAPEPASFVALLSCVPLTAARRRRANPATHQPGAEVRSVAAWQ